jgi:lipopolysaccharide transport system ATP-binding protein
VVDEVLAVGDAEFQKKCMNKMGGVAGEGRTILFVSHNMGAVQAICRRALLLADGRVRAMGPVADVLAEYLKAAEAPDGVPLADRRDLAGDGRFRFAGFRLLDAAGKPTAHAVTGEDCTLCLTLSTPPPGTALTSPLDVAVSIRDYHGRRLTEVATWLTGSSPRTVAEARELRCLIPRLPLLAGQYRVELWCGTAGETQDHVHDAAVLRVEPGDRFRNPADARRPTAERQGCVMIPQQWLAQHD